MGSESEVEGVVSSSEAVVSSSASSASQKTETTSLLDEHRQHGGETGSSQSGSPQTSPLKKGNRLDRVRARKVTVCHH